MKRIIIITVALVLIVICFAGCQAWIFEIPSGYTSREEFFDPKPHMDSVNYCKYYYDGAKTFEKNSEYHIVSESEIPEIIGYFDDTKEWMDSCGRLNEFDFDNNCITSGDYVRIATREGQPRGDTFYGKYDYYAVYLFDTDSNTLFFILLDF